MWERRLISRLTCGSTCSVRHSFRLLPCICALSTRRRLWGGCSSLNATSGNGSGRGSSCDTGYIWLCGSGACCNGSDGDVSVAGGQSNCGATAVGCDHVGGCEKGNVGAGAGGLGSRVRSITCLETSAVSVALIGKRVCEAFKATCGEIAKMRVRARVGGDGYRSTYPMAIHTRFNRAF